MKVSASQTAHAELSRLSAIAKARFGSFRSAAPVAAVPMLVLGSMTASAITAPAAGTFAFDLYDVAVNDMLKGPVGFVGGLAAIVLSAVQITKNWMLAAGGVLGGTAMIKADSITTSLGMII
ncbi:hypothetical protein NUW46_19905 (plasmid) [Marinobacter sp. MA]|jgi:hypothetical protein|uniref:Uncharacterized protein n=2 Tax=Marinobacter TaxID=2742 RepID=A0A5M3PTM9_9GAMM|nr:MULTISPECIES: hypothetical protein [Marinobacter]GBO86293.1 hypothetical protein MS5N3_37440 [Marinobacter salsuginis]|tara:strand:- start:4036 stop:4401 length:366 start_codon:yes stop_codon:yes gene_type:complete|eukprot:TRINITY_DN68542_c0_g1_i1.p1 TRINITY_DN68542_c0_g1~~TRINITY_DN68542_c0_g1_i1.p1  ORF type:complete len:122 (-),score=20.02 TRINITY_DN68542_c0_g1_i1:362-727(-)